MAKEINPKNCTTDNEIEQAINGIAYNCKHFKIGKTGETVQGRGNQEDYQDYDFIQSLCVSKSKDVISQKEKMFIDKFIYRFNNDNDKDGEQSLSDSMADSNWYHLYIVWK